MGRARHMISRPGMAREDVRHRTQDMLDPLARTEQSNREQQRILAGSGTIDPFHVGNAVRNHLGRMHRMMPAQDPQAHPAHHDDTSTAIDQLLHHAVLRGIGPVEHRVERQHHRQLQRIDQFEQMRSGIATIDAEFVLDADDPHAALVEPLRGPAVRCRVILVDALADFRRIERRLPLIVDGDHRQIRRRANRVHRVTQVAGKRGDAAATRDIAADKPHISVTIIGIHPAILGRIGSAAVDRDRVLHTAGKSPDGHRATPFLPLLDKSGRV